MRYIAPRHIDDGVVNGGAFLRRPNEEAASVNWLEYFDPPLAVQIQGVRNCARLNYAKSGRLAQLNVGEVIDYVRQESISKLTLSIVHDPLPANGPYPADHSHSLVYGVPASEAQDGAIVMDLIAECIIEPLHATKD